MEFLHRTWAEIDSDALVHNIKTIKEKTGGSKIMAVVKANAYGHEVGIVAPILDQNGADGFAVSNITEALNLRNLNIKKPILILGYTPAEYAKELYDNNITQCVFSYEYATALSNWAVKNNVVINVHIKLDTGMSRLGFDCRDESLKGVESGIAAIKLPNLNAEGVFTHFSLSDRSDDCDDGFTNIQYNRFINAIEKFKANGITFKICHCCNSAATVKDSDKHLNICRPGIVLYGLNPSSAKEFECGFKPVMTFKSVVSMVKEIEKGNTVSYGNTFKADKKMTVATISAGYADGYPRRLSNKAYVIINGKKANILGRVCMDQMTVDVSDIKDVKMGDEVILFGKELSADILAELSDTINYEIVCGVSARVPRVKI